MRKRFPRLVLLGLIAVALAAAAYWYLGQRPAGPLVPGVVPSQPVSYAGPSPTVDSLRAAAKNANVIICVLDAARASHFGAYGYQRETTPNFDALAKEAIVFDNHFCQYPQTSPSTACLFTSQYPDTHGAGVQRPGVNTLQPLDPASFTVEQGMQVIGYRALIFTSTPAAAPALGLGADFQVKVTPAGQARDPKWRMPSHLLGEIANNLQDRSESPFFAYIHFLPPHYPYEAPEEVKKLFLGKQPPDMWQSKAPFGKALTRSEAVDPPRSREEWINLYDANLRWGDWALGELVKLLKQRGLYDNTLLIVTADHGEALREHQYEWHATCPFDEAIHIPLLIRFPHGKGPIGRVGALTQTIDLCPTILDLFEVGYPADRVQGESLLPLLTGKVEEAHRYIFCRTGGEHPCYVVRDHHSALLLYEGAKMRAFYDLDTDSLATRNVIAQQPRRAAELTKAFVAFAQRQKYPPLDFVDPSFKPTFASGGPQVTIPEETRRKLRALGYVD